MKSSTGLQSITTEYRWGVVDASEPPDIRLVRGYITVLEHCVPADGSFVDYKLLFSDAEGRSLTAFSPQDFMLFASAAVQAMATLTKDDVDESDGPLPIAALVQLASPETS